MVVTIIVFNEEAKMKELIDEDLKGWNVQLLQQIFFLIRRLNSFKLYL
jgi:hypothetical protein